MAWPRVGKVHWRAVHFKNQLLIAVMEELAGNAEISFEGQIGSLNFGTMPGASTKETEVLKRSTLWLRQDFVIVPLERDTIQPIIKAMGGTIPRSIIHIQIAKAGRLEFGAYDHFHPAPLLLGEALDENFQSRLVSRGILE